MAAAEGKNIPVETVKQTEAKVDCCACSCHRVPVTLRDTFFQDPFFSTSWDEFDKVRKEMIAESRLAWQRFEDELKRMEQNSGFSAISHMKQDSSGSSSNENQCKDLLQDDSTFNRQKWFSPMKLMRFPSLFGDEKNRDSLYKEDQVIKVKDDTSAFEVTMDTSQYRPDELKVNVMNGTLSVEAKHVENSEDGSKFISRQFVRKYTLPSDCKHEQVSSNLSSDGVLIISAPKMPPQITEAGRNVPIKRN